MTDQTEAANAAAEPEAPPPEKMWEGKQIDYREVTYGQMKRIRKLNESDREGALMQLLIMSMYYTGTNQQVFKDINAIDAVPARQTNLLIRHAGEAMKANVPEDASPST